MEKSRFFYFDIIHCIAMITLVAIGLIFVFSATRTSGHMIQQPFFYKQLFGACSGLFLYSICTLIDHRTLMRWGYFLYPSIIATLIFTLLKGSIGMGAQRWINLVLFKVQPSELVKTFFPAFFAYYIRPSNKKDDIEHKRITPVLVVLCISVILIIKQPDLGTALLVLFVGLTLCRLFSTRKRLFLYGAIATICASPLLWKTLKPYQKKRIAVFLGYGENNKDRYQIEQAAIAIGSGGMYGKGTICGTQNKLHFLPEGRTDFIFAILCEEWGFLGALFVLFLYALLFVRSFGIIEKTKDRSAQYFALGILLSLIFSTVINIGMVLGLLPVVGIPLPLMSYGICNLWVTLTGLGIIQNIAMSRRYQLP